MGKPAARITDITAHGFPLVGPNPCYTVLIEKLPAWNLASVNICAMPIAPPPLAPAPHGPETMTTVSSSVMIEKLPAARQGDTLIGITPNTIAVGCFSVIIGG